MNLTIQQAARAIACIADDEGAFTWAGNMRPLIERALQAMGEGDTSACAFIAMYLSPVIGMTATGNNKGVRSVGGSYSVEVLADGSVHVDIPEGYCHALLQMVL